MTSRVMVLCVVLSLAACTGSRHPLDDFEPVAATTVVAAPDPVPTRRYDPKASAHGKYLVELLGCGACHTDGALIGEPNPARLLAGSRVGIAHSNPLQVDKPGVVFPANLTPDAATGIGSLSDENLARAIRGGVNRHGSRSLKVMPVGAYSRITEDDVNAIVAYLRSLPPVAHQVPRNVAEGTKTSELFVHFGVYRNRER